MIVKCEQCQTRFKIPDDKVTDKGVKVRCTKCGHTFRVVREGSADATVVGPAPVPRPAVPSAPDPDPFARFGAPSPIDPSEQTKPGMFALGVEASRIPDLARTMSSLQAIPPAPSPFPLPPEGETVPAAASPAMRVTGFDLGAFAPPPPVAPLRPTASPPSGPGPSPFDFGALVPPPRTSPPSPQAPAPFDFSSLGSPGAPAPSAFDFGGGSQATTPGYSLGPPSATPADPFAGVSMEPSGDPAAASSGAIDPFAAVARSGGSGGFGDLMASAAAHTQASDASMFPDLAAPPGSTGTGLSPEAARAMFDMPSAPPHQALPDIGLPPPEVTQVAPAPVAPEGPSPVRVTQSTPTRIAPEVAPPRRGRAIGVLVNLGMVVVLAAVLLVVGSVFANEGKLDASSFSVEHLKAAFAPPSEFVATDISNGLYETRAGRPVFFVRGEVTNTGATTVPVKVRAEILEGNALVRSVEGFAGPAPSPEELRALQTPDDLERLLARQAGAAKPLEPGASAAFVVAFFEYPPDLKAFRVRVATAPGAR